MKRLNNFIVSKDSPSNEKFILPNLVRTRSGVEFDPRLDLWFYRDNSIIVSINFSLMEGVSESFIFGLKFVLTWYVEHRSPYSLRNMFYYVGHLCRALGENRVEPIYNITAIDLINYRASLDENTSWYLTSLSGMLKRWHDIGIQCVTSDAKKLLVQLRLKGNKKGVAVVTFDNYEGPFTEIELQALCAALNDSYASGRVELEKYLLCWLCILLGQRPVQYAALKCCDVITIEVKDACSTYMLRVPRAKQTSGVIRSEFKNRIILPQIGVLLARHAETVRLRFDKDIADTGQAPLFPQTYDVKAGAPVGMECHQTSVGIGNSITATFNELKVFSERTGDAIHINATRFRRTIGTRAADEGHGELIIAELLDHSDTQNVGVYTQATPKMFERIDRAMAVALAPMAQAFAGRLIVNESEALRGKDPRSRIVDPRFDTSFKPMGSCGSFSFCGFAAPIACYTCRNFQPWLDGPHEAVLAHLISERERLMVSSDTRIASINDRTILAVAEVVRLCSDKHEEDFDGDVND